MKRITAEDLAQNLDVDIRRVKDFAHQREHYVFVDRGESAERKYPAHLVIRYKLTGWETQLKLVYSYDVKDEVAYRHLSVSMSAPGEVTSADLKRVSKPFLELLGPVVQLYFPFADELQYNMHASPPVPVVEAGASADGGNVHLRTPVTFHFILNTRERVEDPHAAYVESNALIAASQAVEALATTPPEGLSPAVLAQWREPLFALAREIHGRAGVSKPISE